MKLSITLSEVTAVAPFKSPRSKRQYLFAIYCPSKNYRFQANSQKDADEWIQRIRSETHLDEEEATFMALSKDKAAGSTSKPPEDTTDHTDSDRAGRPSSPELGATLSPNSQARRFAYPPDYSANDMTSFSEWSDGPTNNAKLRSKRSAKDLSSIPMSPRPQEPTRSADMGVLREPERVLCNGYLQCMRTKGAVRQWKRLWVVLRPKSLGFYKDEQVGVLISRRLIRNPN